MAGALATPKLTQAEYLAWESKQTERHDSVDGELYAIEHRGRLANLERRSRSAYACPCMAAVFNIV